ncbi:hypothetical protein PPERSA_10094 [Pseudocohnilembus persalinus]|uniref:2-hydroxyacyl-CoA lyase n=1 Tax=Pseudocohnilembus persalinus TaxID=266149 RepID=A0A0V0QJL5_PSEPJ|nr:hypothetical protein PPERSA_10094 [Pseudocohnilembus persalinus]|eukprot:KRX02477.1 hypothetical protein PPERSA_10094 [Pseudocohnilembus persalinus]
MDTNQVIARALAGQDIKYCFGIVGVPVIELGVAFQAEGINYYGCRNEQAASYSAQAVGYLTRRPGICLCVSGPGMIHGMAGVANAWSNGWPMILIAGASDISQDGKGGFQESNQLVLAQQYCKYSYRVTQVKQIPFVIEKAVRMSIQGRPGPVYIEFPGDILNQKIPEEDVQFLPLFQQVAKSQAPIENIQKSLQLLAEAKKPLVIIGKGAAYAQSEKEVLDFINTTQLPFLPTPMGKGVISDKHELCVGPARSTALGQADVILLIGARLNWMLHFGQAPRFQKNVKILQIDILPEEFDQNVRGTVNLLGDITSILNQFNQTLKEDTNFRNKFGKNKNQEWKNILADKIAKNKKVSQDLMNFNGTPMTYYSSLNVINQYLPDKFIYIGEGANTMDIGRTIINQIEPRTKLDAGTYGTMGIGLPFAIAAQIVHPERPVIAIMGDSAFGFSGMEIETAIRYQLPLIIFIINNNGISMGVEEMPEKKDRPLDLAPYQLGVQIRYEKLAEGLGGRGFLAKNTQELESVCKQIFSEKLQFTIVNVIIDPFGSRKPQEHNWLTKEEPKSKL